MICSSSWDSASTDDQLLTSSATVTWRVIVRGSTKQQNLILVLGETATMKGTQHDPSARLDDGLEEP
jgi:hypothetical protein